MKPSGGKREAKRAALKETLIQSAKQLIQTNGLAGLRARDVTAKSGCALGALYNAFDDLDTLVLHVNTSTLRKLGATLSELSAKQDAPMEKLIGLARGYMNFARNNYNLWTALFDHLLSDDAPVPEWYLREQSVLFEQIAVPVKDLLPGLTNEEAELLSKSLFAAVHGIVAFSLQERFVAVPRNRLDGQLSQLVTAMVKGLSEPTKKNA